MQASDNTVYKSRSYQSMRLLTWLQNSLPILTCVSPELWHIQDFCPRGIASVRELYKTMTLYVRRLRTEDGQKAFETERDWRNKLRVEHSEADFKYWEQYRLDGGAMCPGLEMHMRSVRFLLQQSKEANREADR